MSIYRIIKLKYFLLFNFYLDQYNSKQKCKLQRKKVKKHSSWVNKKTLLKIYFCTINRKIYRFKKTYLNILAIVTLDHLDNNESTLIHHTLVS